MRALVTGASGFVAGWLRSHLEKCGDDIVPVDESIDIGDGPALTSKVVESAPDVIYHLAAISHVGLSWQEPRETFRVNAVGTLELLQAAMACAVPPRVLLVGSAEVYGSVTPADLPLTEAAPLRPVSPYAASKVAAEYLGLQAYLGHGLPVISIRAFNHIGPGQHANFAVPAFARRIIEAQAGGQSFLPVGNVSARRDFTDVRDVVRAYRLLAERGRPGEAYNVCSGHDISIEEVARRLLALAGADLELRVDPELVRPVEVPALLGDASKLVAATGWEPEYDLDETLADVLADLQARSGTA
ncbi:MAG TPA: GDP-mannose 4,6-dehydratase [Acidimicrobiales bacterium]|nr:GDP-mannose 4,6-dehydratase [Acidimicrobiales bacterium]